MPFAPPTLDQAQAALTDALEPLSTGVINTPKQVWALETLQLFAVAKVFGIPDGGQVLPKENQVELTNDQLVALVKKWAETGNMHVCMTHPTEEKASAGINWGQLLQLILPLLLNEVLKRIGK